MTSELRDRILTVNEVALILDVLAGLRFRNPKATLTEAIEDWYKWAKDIPHEHYFSILGPFCAACHGDISIKDRESIKVPI